jgi:hypothetical protein
MASLVNCANCLIFQKLFQKSEDRGILSNSLCEDRISLRLKSEKIIRRKEHFINSIQGHRYDYSK